MRHLPTLSKNQHQTMFEFARALRGGKGRDSSRTGMEHDDIKRKERRKGKEAGKEEEMTNQAQHKV